jgi:hypothetical protein
VPRDLEACQPPSTPGPTTPVPQLTPFNYTLWLIPGNPYSPLFSACRWAELYSMAALIMLLIPVVVAIGRHMLEKRYRSLKTQQDLESLSEMHSLATDEEGDSETLN